MPVTIPLFTYTERMLEVLKNTFIRQESDLPTALCDAVNRDVDTYTDGDEQTDDITMVCVQYTGNYMSDGIS